MSRRAVAPVVGVSLLLAVTVVLAAVIGAFVVGLGSGTEDAPKAAITAEIVEEKGSKRIILTHHGGDSLDANELTVRVFVDGQPLKHQPKVPTYGEDGFSCLCGQFSAFAAQPWTVGEVAKIGIADTTNSPQPTAGSRITVKIYTDGMSVATARVRWT